MIERKLLCFARGKAGSWEAICVDLDIAVTGRSLEEVQALLREAVSSYILDAEREAPADRARLLSRSAPWHVRAALALRYLWHLLASPPGADDYQAGFDLPCRA